MDSKLRTSGVNQMLPWHRSFIAIILLYARGCVDLIYQSVCN